MRTKRKQAEGSHLWLWLLAIGVILNVLKWLLGLVGGAEPEDGQVSEPQKGQVSEPRLVSLAVGVVQGLQFARGNNQQHQQQDHTINNIIS